MREAHRSYCRLCMQSCAVMVDVEGGGHLVEVRVDKDDPVFRGFFCVCVKVRHQPSFRTRTLQAFYNSDCRPR